MNHPIYGLDFPIKTASLYYDRKGSSGKFECIRANSAAAVAAIPRALPAPAAAVAMLGGDFFIEESAIRQQIRVQMNEPTYLWIGFPNKVEKTRSVQGLIK